MTPDLVVISLARHPRRLEVFRRRFARVSDAHVTAFAGIDNPARPAAGCYASHLAVLDAAEGPVVVFEDDAIFASTFTVDVTPPRPAALIWLGGQHLLPPQPVAPGWVQPLHINRTHAYLALDPKALADGLRDRVHQHVDAALSALNVPQLAVSPFTAGQAPAVSTINGRHNATHRFWNS